MKKIDRIPSGTMTDKDWMCCCIAKINELVDSVNKLQAAYEAGEKKGGGK